MTDKPHRSSRSVQSTAHNTAISHERRESELSDTPARNTPDDVLYLTDVVVHHHDWETRMGAVERLAKIDDPATIHPLIQALRDRDSFVRWKAVRGLKEKGHSATEALIKALNNDDGAIRIGAAYTLGSISDKVATLALIGALADEEVDVRARAADALGKIGDTDAVSALICALEDRSKIVRGRALQALIRIGRPAIKPLVQALKSGDEALVTRWMAARTLVSIGEPAVEELIVALDYPAWDVRLRTAETLGQIGDPRAVKPLVSLLDDPDAHVRMQAKDAIAKIGSPAIRALTAQLKHESRLVRGNAVAALAQIVDPRVVKPLVRVLGDLDRFVQNLALVALVGLGEMGTEQLEAALRNKNPCVRQNATKALGMIGDVGAVDYLIPMLKDLEPSIRAAAAEALGNIGDSRAFSALSTLLNDENTFVRANTKGALQKLKPCD